MGISECQEATPVWESKKNPERTKLHQVTWETKRFTKGYVWLGCNYCVGKIQTNSLLGFSFLLSHAQQAMF